MKAKSKRCRKCLQVFSIDMFYINPNTKKPYAHCKPCHAHGPNFKRKTDEELWETAREYNRTHPFRINKLAMIEAFLRLPRSDYEVQLDK